MGKRAKAGRLCVYCDDPATDKDHVPPKNLFPPPRAALITVPSCKNHNLGSSLDDEYFRLSLIVNAVVAPHPAARIAWPSAFRGLRRQLGAGLTRAFLGRIRRTPVLSPAGLYLGNTMTYAVDGMRQARVAARIMRGVHYQRTKTRLPDHYVLAYPLPLALKFPAGYGKRMAVAAMGLTNRPPNLQLGRGTFTYWSEDVAGVPVTVWVLLFFQAMPFVGWSIPKAFLPSGHRGYGFP